MKVVALICARGGSKGLPGKNIRDLHGRPLIAWSVLYAKEVQRVDRVIVSTDSEEIASVAREYGAEVPFIRPDELSGDKSPEWVVWRHLLQFLKDSDYGLPDCLLVVPATAPLRKATDLENVLDKFETFAWDVVLTVTDSYRSPYFNMIKKNEDDSVGLVIPPEGLVQRRQDAPVVYDITTVAYAVKPEFVFSHNGLFEGRAGAVHVPVERSLDIDTMWDFKIAESMFGVELQ